MHERLHRHKDKLAQIKLLGADFDGVFTNGKVLTDSEGIEAVTCCHKDGFGVNLLCTAGIIVHVITVQKNPVVAHRSRKMLVPCTYGLHKASDKQRVLAELMERHGLTPEQVAFCGDDLNDQEALRFAGFKFTVANANPAIKDMADYVTTASGGDGAIREIAELLLMARGIDPVELAKTVDTKQLAQALLEQEQPT